MSGTSGWEVYPGDAASGPGRYGTVIVLSCPTVEEGKVTEG